MKFTSSLSWFKHIVIFLVLSISACVTASAQEYKYEIGGMAGMSMYMGDANKNSFFEGWHPSAGLVFRKNINFRWAAKADLLMGKVSGDTQNSDNVYPFNQQTAFERSFYELGGQMEFNFFPYSDKFAYLQTKKISPYMFAGFGLTFAPGGGQSFMGVNFPLGIGVKYKVKNRVNLVLEYSFRKLFSDGFDAPNNEGFNLNDPYKMGSNWLKNNDWYSLILFSVTWDFGPNGRLCTNLE